MFKIAFNGTAYWVLSESGLTKFGPYETETEAAPMLSVCRRHA
jgi:hypothetical protein